jgi:hypothetical protein
LGGCRSILQGCFLLLKPSYRHNHHLPRQTNPKPQGPHIPTLTTNLTNRHFTNLQTRTKTSVLNATPSHHLHQPRVGLGEFNEPKFITLITPEAEMVQCSFCSTLTSQSQKWNSDHFCFWVNRVDTRVGVVLNGAGVFSKGVSCL